MSTHSDRDGSETMVERGRRLASEREDLIASGVDPSLLSVPAGPPLHEPADRDADNVSSFERLLADPSFDPGPITVRLCDDDGTVRSGLFHSGVDYACTGSAHHKGARLICSNPIHRDGDNVPSDRVEYWCEVMHDAYERAAIGAGWETNPASRKPWADVPEANKVTMRAAVRAVVAVADREQAALRAENARLRTLVEAAALETYTPDGSERFVAAFHRVLGEKREAEDAIARVEALAFEWDAEADAYADERPAAARAVLYCSRELRVALRGPEPTLTDLSDARRAESEQP